MNNPVDDNEEPSDEDNDDYSVAFLPKIGIWPPTPNLQHGSNALSMGTNIIEDYMPLQTLPGKSDDDSDEIVFRKYTMNPVFTKFLDYFDWEENETVLQKILFFVRFPMNFIQHLTIHWAEEDKYYRPFLVINPLAFCAFFCFVFDFYKEESYYSESLPTGPVPIFVFILGVGLILSIIVFLTTSPVKPPFYDFVFTYFGLITSAIWIFLIANELVGIMKSLGILLTISPSIMGLTVLAWGNSIGDLISNILMARRGFGQMALSASYASPYSNLMIGLGLGVTINMLMKGADSFPIKEDNLDNNLFLSFLFLAFNLIFTIIVVSSCSFTLKKPFGVILLTIYLTFLVLAILTNFEIIFKESLWGLLISQSAGLSK